MNTETQRIAVGYLRVSTAEQAAEGVSLAAQEERIRAWCQAFGYELVAVYRDDGVSGATLERPGVSAAVAAACDVGGTLVVYSLSRLSRSLTDHLGLVEKLQGAGANLASITEEFDTAGATGKLVFRILAMLAEWERDQVVDRTKTAMRHLRSQNKRAGHVPYGYDMLADGSLVLNEKEQEAIGIMKEMRRMKKSMLDICEILRQLGYPTKHGGPWRPTVVWRLTGGKSRRKFSAAEAKRRLARIEAARTAAEGAASPPAAETVPG